MARTFHSFPVFYRFYLGEHSNRICRRLHIAGSLLVLAILAMVLVTRFWWGLWLLPVVGYGFAWVGHFFFEKNRPATFKHPVYSLMGDWVMLADVLRGRVRL
ncbi:MAG TPA: Mpo1-like protein [Gammaproteobacteria bacterium]|nr:Mpo1-like protein [Gammaproteobacteria bacterium]